MTNNPAGIKLGITGCQRYYSESQLRDIGLIGNIRGWMIFSEETGGHSPG